MMLYSIGSYTPLEGRDELQSSASYHKVPPRFRQTLDAVPMPETASADSAYTVKSGDTLAEIVRRRLQALGHPADNVAVFDAVRDVAKQNHLPNANRLHVGQKLELGGLDGAASTPTPMNSAAKALPPIEVEVLPPLPPKSPRAAAKPLVEATPLPEPNLPDTALNEDAGPGGGGRMQPIGPLAAFSAQRSVMLSPGAQGGPAHPLGLGLLANLAPEVRYPIARATGRPDLGRLIDRLLAPGHAHAENEVLPSAAVPQPEAASPWERTVDAPVRLTSNFGLRKDPFTRHADFHEGIDLAAESGSDIHPVLPGTVTFSGWQRGYGRVVIVDHGDGVESVYGHTAKNLVQRGDAVTEKTVLGQVGSSGRATGPHLHLEVRKDGTAIDPIAYLSAPGNLEVAKND